MNVEAAESIGGAQKGLKPSKVQDLGGRVEDESGIVVCASSKRRSYILQKLTG